MFKEVAAIDNQHEPISQGFYIVKSEYYSWSFDGND